MTRFIGHTARMMLAAAVLATLASTAAAYKVRQPASTVPEAKGQC